MPQLFLGITYLAKSTLCVLEIHLSSCGSLTMWQWSDPAQGYRDLKLWVVVRKHLFTPNLQCQSVLLLFSLVCPSWVGGKADHPPCITGLGISEIFMLVSGSSSQTICLGIGDPK